MKTRKKRKNAKKSFPIFSRKNPASAKNMQNVRSSTQGSIPYKAMYRDGICHGKDGRFF